MVDFGKHLKSMRYLTARFEELRRGQPDPVDAHAAHMEDTYRPGPCVDHHPDNHPCEDMP